MVFWTACSSFWTVSLSLLTAAVAEARLASRVAALCLLVEEPALWLPPELVGDDEPVSVVFLPFESPDLPPEVGVVGVVFVLGSVVGLVVVGAVVVCGVVVVEVGVVLVLEVAAVKVV